MTPELKTIIGNRVTVGHGVMLHSCQIEDDVLIGMGAIILDGAIIKKGALVAGCVAPPHKVVRTYHLVMRNLMRVVHLLTPEEQQQQIENARLYVNLGREYQSQQ